MFSSLLICAENETCVFLQRGDFFKEGIRLIVYNCRIIHIYPSLHITAHIQKKSQIFVSVKYLFNRNAQK